MKAKGPIAAATILVVLCAGAAAAGVKSGEGDLVTVFDAHLRPVTLPRARPSAVAIRIAGNVKSASGRSEALPQLRHLTVAINREGGIDDRGLPVCAPRQIQPASEAGARAECGGAIVGSGHVAVQERIREQLPFTVHARVLAFNGPRRRGHRQILAQVFVTDPPGSFILPFGVSPRQGAFGTVLSATLPASARRWAYLTHFDLTLGRVYTHRGVRRSYLSARCNASPGFDTAVFPLAKPTYGFATGQRFSMTVTSTCHVAR